MLVSFSPKINPLIFKKVDGTEKMTASKSITVEDGTFILGFLSCILSCILLSSSILVIIGLFTMLLVDPELDSNAKAVEFVYVFMPLVCGAMMLSVVNIIFTVLLCKGVGKRKASYIKAYFIYGIVLLVLSLVFSILGTIYLEEYGWSRYCIWSIEAIFVCIFSLLLSMVYKTYHRMNSTVDLDPDEDWATDINIPIEKE